MAKKFEVSWRYAIGRRDENGDPITDPRRSGGEYVYQAETPDEALDQFMTAFRKRDYVQPFEPELLQVHVYEMLGGYQREEIVSLLKGLTVDELDGLMAEVVQTAVQS